MTRPRSLATHGLTHIALAVKSPARSLKFYRAVFGVRETTATRTRYKCSAPGPRT